MVHEDLVNVVGMRRTSSDVIPHHLEHVPEPGGIVDIDVGDDALVAFEERHLEVAEGVE